MGTFKRKLTGGAATILHSIGVPLYILFFITFYKPRGIDELLEMEHASFTFNVTILFCIILVSISITRGWLYLIARYKEITRPVYATWCFAEMLIAALFSSLYVSLMLKEPMTYYEIAGYMATQIMTSGIYPYAIIWLTAELSTADTDTTPDDSSLIRFHDEYKKLKLVIAPEAVIFIKSEENYVQIHYNDKGKTKKFILRSSMKALEETLSKRGLVRCHRSYFINPAYIKIVHRNNAGMIVAELNLDTHESIPISRKYHEEITRLL
jgi:hypothetical protein